MNWSHRDFQDHCENDIEGIEEAHQTFVQQREGIMERTFGKRGKSTNFVKTETTSWAFSLQQPYQRRIDEVVTRWSSNEQMLNDVYQERVPQNAVQELNALADAVEDLMRSAQIAHNPENYVSEVRSLRRTYSPGSEGDREYRDKYIEERVTPQDHFSVRRGHSMWIRNFSKNTPHNIARWNFYHAHDRNMLEDMFKQYQRGYDGPVNSSGCKTCKETKHRVHLEGSEQRQELCLAECFCGQRQQATNARAGRTMRSTEYSLEFVLQWSKERTSLASQLTRLFF
ncbi:hypothetical protein L596_014789 [Steinernema carpocapsae]|uniref:Uncharacterized protein n=1 Tax=Steinernema carpocapsae TaxID=34508 RepID=A0A4U5NDT0_STECR|nr:hypothetical protein L596_014789 [Steinernema carpocapsae]